MTHMKTSTCGWIFRQLGICNPAGFVLDHTMTELGLGRREVMNHTGLDEAALDAALDPQSEICVMDASARAKMFDLMMVVRGSDLAGLQFGSGGIISAFQAQQFHEGVELLAQHVRCPATGASAETRFHAAARRAGRSTHVSAMTMFGEAAWGHLDQNCKLMTLNEQFVMRQRFGELMMRIEAHHDRDAALTREARDFIAAGDLWSGINAAADQIETWEVLRQPLPRLQAVLHLEPI